MITFTQARDLKKFSSLNTERKITIKLYCTAHGNRVCVHVGNHGFDDVKKAERYLKEDAQTIVDGEVVL